MQQKLSDERFKLLVMHAMHVVDLIKALSRLVALRSRLQIFLLVFWPSQNREQLNER